MATLTKYYVWALDFTTGIPTRYGAFSFREVEEFGANLPSDTQYMISLQKVARKVLR